MQSPAGLGAALAKIVSRTRPGGGASGPRCLRGRVVEAEDGLNTAPLRPSSALQDPKGWTVFEIPSTLWMPSAHQIRFLRSRWGASQPSTLKSVILVRRARSRWPRTCGGPVAHEKQRLAHFTGDGGQRWRDRNRTLSWRCCICSRLQRGLSPWRKQWTRRLGFW